MKTLIFGLYTILFFAIPVFAILIAGNSFGKHETVKLVGKALSSFFFYLLSTVVTFFILDKLSYESDAIRSTTASEQILGLLIVYLYGFTGYLICSYINGAFLKPWKFSPINSKKDKTIINLN